MIAMPEYVVMHGSIRFYDEETGPSGRRYKLGEVVELDDKDAQKLLELGALRPLDEVDRDELDPSAPSGEQRTPLERPKGNDSAEAWINYANEEYSLGLAPDTSRSDAIKAVEQAEKRVGQ